MKKATTLMLAVLTTATAAQAALTISIIEDDSDIVVSAVGTANTTGMSPLLTTPTTGYGTQFLYAGNIFSYTDGYSRYELNGELTAFAGTYFTLSTSQHNGDTFGVSFNNSGNDRLILPRFYVSGTPISGSMTFANTSFADLNIDPNYSATYSFNSGPNLDTVTVQAVIPEPASLGLLALGSLAMLRRRTRKP